MLVGVCGALLSFVAIFNMPYGFYTFNRVAISLLAIWLAVISVRAGRSNYLWLLIPVIVLWNPAIPFRLDRATWLPLNLVAALIFLFCGWKLRNPISTGK